MNIALARGEWESFSARQSEARERGRLRGIAVANYVEIASGIPRERAEVAIRPDGYVDVTIGTLSSGQGHETSFAQLVTEWLDVPLEKVNIVTGDTDKVQAGGGSHAGRSMRLAAVVISRAAQELIARGTRIAAAIFGVEESAIAFRSGRFAVRASDKSLSIFDVAALAEREPLPAELRGTFLAVCDETVKEASFPFGSHVCEVEIDPETGAVEIVRYVAVDDVGRAINPLILHGQTHGGIVQGVGQALSEQCVYDRESGQMLSGSFMDYGILRASNVPPFVTEISEVSSPTNPLGVRAGGEGGTTPALAVIVNAVVDALSEYGIEHIEMPVTPSKIWHAIAQATQRR